MFEFALRTHPDNSTVEVETSNTLNGIYLSTMHQGDDCAQVVWLDAENAREVGNALIEQANKLEPKTTFKVGDRVQLITHEKPTFGWGLVRTYDIGVVRGVEDWSADHGGRLRVQFPAQDTWYGLPHEFNKLDDTFADLADLTPTSTPPRYVNLSDQARTIYRHMMRAGSISAREAMSDYGITSATLARRICDIENEGFEIARVKKTHPITGRRYTRYSFGH